MTATDAGTEELLRIDRDHVVHPWLVQSEHRPTLVTRAEGNYIWDASGRRYLDFTAQQWHANVGHGEHRIAEAIAEHAGGLSTITSFATEPRSRLTEKLLSLLPPSYERVFYGCNGSDAIEAALKTARLVTGRQNVVAFWNAYHGGSMAATSVTGLANLRNGFGQGVPGTVFVPPPYHYRSALAGADQAETDARTLDEIRRTITQVGADTVAAVIGEPFNATTGMVPGSAFWKGMRALCDELEILLIGDEVVAGFGRTGHWFARDYYDYEPDILLFAKGLTSGYLPLSAAVFRKNVADRFVDRLFPHGLTYSGHTLCCVAALANIAVMEEDNLIPRAAAMGKYLEEGLRSLASRHACVGDVRTIGLYGAIELVADRESRATIPDELSIPGLGEGCGAAAKVAAHLKRGGVLVNAMRVQGIVKMSPPLTIDASESDAVIALLDDALGHVDRALAR